MYEKKMFQRSLQRSGQTSTVFIHLIKVNFFKLCLQAQMLHNPSSFKIMLVVCDDVKEEMEASDRPSAEKSLITFAR